MSVQTTYAIKTKPAYDGQKADMNDGDDVSKTVETAAIEFGRVVSRGSTDEKVVLGGGAGAIGGIAIRELELEGGIPQVGERITVRTRGPVMCLVDGAGAKGLALNYDQVTGHLTTAAVAGDVVAVSNGSVVLSFAKTDEAEDVDNIVRVELVGLAS